MTKRSICRAFLAMAAGVMLFPVAAQDFPTRPARIVVPNAAGGPTDGMARLLAEGLSKRWPHPVVVENRAGGNMIIGTTAVAQAPADGHTIGLIGMPHIVNPALQEKMPYRALEDFSPVIHLAHIPLVVAVSPSLGAGSIAELVRMAKDRPGALNYSSTSQAGAGHLAAEMFRLRAGIQIGLVSYGGAAPAMVDLLAGRVPVMFGALNAVESHIRWGAVRGIAVTTDRRIAALPDVPTMIEAGFPGFTVSAWLGLVVRAGTPEATIAKINEGVAAILQSGEDRAKLQAQGWTVLPIGPERQAFGDFLRSEQAKWSLVIREAGIKP